jgi:hypothetical protein
LKGQVVFSDRNIFSRKGLTAKAWGGQSAWESCTGRTDIEQDSETVTDLYFERKMYGSKESTRYF